jgi:23S rRNA (cytidine1920-2'-O)/16S rRNA (cytidine1409-2'-O)-methyltransferase
MNKQRDRFVISSETEITPSDSKRYASRAGLKLASVAKAFNLNFKSKVVLDVGSSTGGFTDYSLQHGAKRVVAVDIGTNQLHPRLRADNRVELYEKTDIRSIFLNGELPTIILIDISFMSLREILPHVAKHLGDINSEIVAMVKPQFEAKNHQLVGGIVKNEAMRRHILKDFELWAKTLFVIEAKKDSEVSGKKGNQERFYLLRALKR